MDNTARYFLARPIHLSTSIFVQHRTCTHTCLRIQNTDCLAGTPTRKGHRRCACIQSQKVCMHTVTEGVHTYSHRKCAFTQSQKVCIHIVTERVHTHSHRKCAYTQSQNVCIHTVTEGVHTYSHRKRAYTQTQNVCIHSPDRTAM